MIDVLFRGLGRGSVFARLNHLLTPESGRGRKSHWGIWLAVWGWAMGGAGAWAAPSLTVEPAGNLSSTGFAHGPFSSLSRVYTVSNAGPGVLSWSAGKDRGWISLSRNGGNLAVGQADQVEVLINSLALDLPVTNEVATVAFVNLNNFLERVDRLVQLTIGLPGAGSVATVPVTSSNMYAITLTGVAGTTYVLEKSSPGISNFNPIVTNTFSGPTAKYDLTIDGGPPSAFRSVSSGAGAQAAQLTLGRVTVLNSTLLRLTGEANGTYRVEATTNNTDWVALSTNKLPASGEVEVRNTVLDPAMVVGYRAVAVGALSVPVLHHVLIVGESLALGFDGSPALSTTPSPSNYRFRSDASGDFFVPLAEGGFETIASGAGAQVVAQAPLHPMLFSNIGQNGALYDLQQRGTPLFDLGVEQFRDAPQVVACQLLGYAPSAVFVVAGEGDFLNPDYASDIRQWQADYEAAIQYLTGFTGTIPMFHSQVSGWTAASVGGLETGLSPFQVLAESEANPAKTVLVGPRYCLPHAGPGALFPGLHLSNVGYRWLGEYYAKAYKATAVDGGAWTPLRPASITRAGAVITASFHVPVPPLVLDTTLVTNPGSFGFEFFDESGNPPAITGVTVSGPDTVEIQLAAVPTGANQRLRYAYRGIPGNDGGPTTGPRGNLRDSDATPSLFGNTLYNWCVHFDKPVN